VRKTFAAAHVRGLFNDLYQLVSFKPDQDGINRSIHNICEAEGVQPPRDFVAVGFFAAYNFKDAALKHTFEHFR